MDKVAVIVTHHKTGTVWMGQVFRKIATALEIPFVVAGRDKGATPLTPPLVLGAANASFVSSYPGADMRQDHLRFLHVIRDPRDIWISAMHYHLLANEKWLHRPQDRLGGKTLQQGLNALATERERYLFEMTYGLPQNLANMVSWDKSLPNSVECRYEDMIADVEGTRFRETARHLGFDAREIPVCAEAFWKQSIFGGKADRKSAHVRSGAARQWPSVFDRSLAIAFEEQHGAALVTLGYERDSSWIDTVPENNPTLDRRLTPEAG